MKSAEELLKEWRSSDSPYIHEDDVLGAIRDYGKQCAEEYLRDAIATLNEDGRVTTLLGDNDISIMTATPIGTP